MNSKYLGNVAGPFVDKQSSVFMTETSMQHTSQSPKMRI